jgi:ribosome biogenesis GTPase
VTGTAGERITCQLQNRSLKPVVGDDVAWRRQADDTGTVTEIRPRRSALTRIDSRGRAELVAANLTRLVVVVASDPAPDWFLVDRYLAAAELAGLDAIIVFNKADLTNDMPAELAAYAELGYAICRTSAARGSGLDTLAGKMRDHRSVLIGQSGVGKSSLLNGIVGDALQTVGELSQKGGQGKHTTSTAVLYSLPAGGELIDSPGVRDFAPHIADPRAVMAGFREFRGLWNTCRFPDCRHLAEPACAIKAAVSERRVAERRYASYVRLHELTDTLQSKVY